MLLGGVCRRQWALERVGVMNVGVLNGGECLGSQFGRLGENVSSQRTTQTEREDGSERRELRKK